MGRGLLSLVARWAWAWIATVGFAAGAEVRLVGSDLLGVAVSRALLMAAHRNQQPVALALDGSRPGLEELRAGRAPVALLSLPPAEAAALRDFVAVPVAWHRVVVLAPAHAPVDEISLPQLAAAFGQDGPGLAQAWGEVGAVGEWSRRPLRLLIPAVGTGLARELFRHGVLAGGAFRSDADSFRTEEDLALRFRGEGHALALAGAPPAVGSRVLAVARRPGEPAFTPTAANLENGDYPLGLPLWLVVAPREQARLVPLARIILGDDLAAEFSRAGLVARLPAARRQSLQAWENGDPKILQK